MPRITWTIPLLALLFAAPAAAHNPSLASLRLHVLDEGAMLELYVPTAGVESAFAERFEDEFALDEESGQERFIRYIKNTVELRSPGGTWTLGAGGIRVGGHETVVRLTARAPAGDWFPLDIDAPLFAENAGERVTFRYIDGDTNVRVVLNEDNAFAASVVPVEAGLTAIGAVHESEPASPAVSGSDSAAAEPVASSGAAPSPWWLLPFGALALGGLMTLRHEGRPRISS